MDFGLEMSLPFTSICDDCLIALLKNDRQPNLGCLTFFDRMLEHNFDPMDLKDKKLNFNESFLKLYKNCFEDGICLREREIVPPPIKY